MALKFSGTSTDFALRWYNTATGELKAVPYADEHYTEIDFSRNV